MADFRRFAIEVDKMAKCEVTSPDPATLSFSVYCEDQFYTFEDEKVPLGKFLSDLGLTARDCQLALQAWEAQGDRLNNSSNGQTEARRPDFRVDQAFSSPSPDSSP